MFFTHPKAFLSTHLQHRGRVRASGRRRGELQSVLHPTQIREGPGGGSHHHPPQAGVKARDLVGARHQQLMEAAAAGMRWWEEAGWKGVCVWEREGGGIGGQCSLVFSAIRATGKLSIVCMVGVKSQ